MQNPSRAKFLRELYAAMTGREWKPRLEIVINRGVTPVSKLNQLEGL